MASRGFLEQLIFTGLPQFSPFCFFVCVFSKSVAHSPLVEVISKHGLPKPGEHTATISLGWGRHIRTSPHSSRALCVQCVQMTQAPGGTAGNTLLGENQRHGNLTKVTDAVESIPHSNENLEAVW